MNGKKTVDMVEEVESITIAKETILHENISIEKLKCNKIQIHPYFQIKY
jgi:hypothetical protein